MTCVVFGASGLIGTPLLQRLRARGEKVVAVSRGKKRKEGAVTWLRGSLPEAAPRLPADTRVIVCVGPLDQFSHWLARAEIHGRPVIVAMSSMSAESKRHSPDRHERDVAARLRESEARLLERCRALGSRGVVLRATLIYGGPSGSLEALAARSRRWHVFPLPGGKGLRQPVHADDLARAVLAAWDHDAASGRVCVGGGECLQVRAMYARARRRLAPDVMGLPLPAVMVRWLSAATGRMKGVTRRLDEDLVVDNTELVDLLGVRPRGFMPGETQGPGRTAAG